MREAFKREGLLLNEMVWDSLNESCLVVEHYGDSLDFYFRDGKLYDID